MIAVTETDTPIPTLAPLDGPLDTGFGGLVVGVDLDGTVVEVLMANDSDKLNLDLVVVSYDFQWEG